MVSYEVVRVNDVDFAYLHAGPRDGPFVLCLHGFPDHALTWERLLVDLADAGFHAVAPWTRGFSPTGLAPDDSYDLGSLALDALALTDVFSSAPGAALIGHDFGASTAYAAVGHRPDRFQKLVTLGVPHPLSRVPFVHSPAQLQRLFYVFLFQTNFAQSALESDDFALIEFLWRQWSPGHAPSSQFMTALKDTYRSPGSARAAIQYYRAAFGDAPVNSAVSHVTAARDTPPSIPTLYLHGEDDGVLTLDQFDPASLERLLPEGSSIQMVPGAGHFLHLDRPDDVNRRIVAFLAPEHTAE